MDCHSVKAKVTHFALLIGLPLPLFPDLRLQVGGPRRVEVEQSLPPLLFYVHVRFFDRQPLHTNFGKILKFFFRILKKS